VNSEFVVSIAKLQKR